MIGTLIGWVTTVFMLIIGAVLLWHLLMNGAQYGAMLGDGVNGAIDFVQSFFDSVAP